MRIDRTSGTLLELYTDISQAFTGTPANPSRKNISSDIRINGAPLSAVQDICIRGDYIYLLFSVSKSGVSEDGNGGYYSAGGLVRYKIIQGANALEIGNAETFGFDSVPQFTTVSFPQIVHR